MVKRVLRAIDTFQRRRPVVAVPMAVLKRFGEHGGGRLAATISYWSFFSLFPLMLAFVTILNLVLKDDPETRQELVDGALGQIPVLGSELSAPEAIGGSWTTILFGLLAALWTGIAAAKALQVALDEIWDIPRFRRPNAAVQRTKALGFLVLLAVGISTSTLAAQYTAAFESGWMVRVTGLVVTLVVDGAVLLATFRFLTTGPNKARDMVPGTIFGGIGLVALQLLGTWVVDRYIKGASDTYGTFAIVIALLSWFFLVSRVLLYGAELNAVLAHDVWPRSLTEDGEPTAGDRQAAELNAQRVQDDPRLEPVAA
jgi:YihY family inner membrane protein